MRRSDLGLWALSIDGSIFIRNDAMASRPKQAGVSSGTT